MDNEPPKQLRRGRTRDYYIPVRLNQQQPTLTILSQSSVDIAQIGRAMRMMVSIVSAKRSIPYLLVLIVLVASIQVEQINCDNGQLNASRHKLSKPEETKQPIAAAAAKQLKGSKTTATTKKGSGAIDTKRHREKLLAMLSENIERQHLKVAASIGVASLQRPSKFDSGEELISHEFPTSGKTSKTKSDDIFKDIMRMHEQPSAVAIKNSLHYTFPDTSGQVDTQKSQPLIGIQSSIAGKNKLASQILSYIVTPFVGASKLSDTRELLRLSNFSLPTIRPVTFTGRSNKYIRQSATASLATPTQAPAQNLFLPLPTWISHKNNRQLLYSTKPSAMFGDDSSNWMMSSSTSSSQAEGDLMADSSSLKQKQMILPTSADHISPSRRNRGNNEPVSSIQIAEEATSKGSPHRPPLVANWLKNGANKVAQNYLQDSFRGLLTLSQLPILPAGPVSTAPSVLEPQSQQQKRRNHHKQSTQMESDTSTSLSSPTPNSTSDKKGSTDRRAKALEELYRYAYIVGTSMRRKRDPLKALSTKNRPQRPGKNGQFFTQRSIGQLAADNRRQMMNLAKAIQEALFASSSPLSPGKQQANPRGVMWDMATDPTLVATLMHLVERASVALPLGFLLMPIVHMIQTPLNGFNLGQVLPPRAVHRSVEHELLAKRLDAVDKVLSRALRPTHRESFIGKK